MNGNIIEIKMPERIAIDNSNEFSKTLNNVSIPENTEKVVLDASELDYISSVGLRILVKFTINNSCPLCIINVNAGIYKIMKMTGLTKIIEVEEPV